MVLESSDTVITEDWRVCCTSNELIDNQINTDSAFCVFAYACVSIELVSWIK